jgi:hypothetical protein
MKVKHFHNAYEHPDFPAVEQGQDSQQPTVNRKERERERNV